MIVSLCQSELVILSHFSFRTLFNDQPQQQYTYLLTELM